MSSYAISDLNKRRCLTKSNGFAKMHGTENKLKII